MIADPQHDWTLQRIVLPITLLAGCIIRINLMSFVYGILLMLSPFLSAPGVTSVSWWTKRFVVTTSVVGMSCGIVQILFHVSQLSDPPYGHGFLPYTLDVI
uniref:Piezo TM1-24 domain-containing protein n=1 Tax=Plectus sambesii TaxID=2011161 RepID=A0A914VEL0_9BILA